jgi:hypothetical protein
MNFCFLLVGGTPFYRSKEFAPIEMGKKTYTVENFTVAVSTSVFGVSWLVAWLYFLTTNWDSFISQFDSLILHVVLQFITSIALIVSGIGLFKQWKRSKGIFLTAMITLFASVGIALTSYGPRGHGEPTLMYLLGICTLVVGGFLTAGTYLLDGLVHDWDEKLPKNELKDDV